MSWYVSTGPVAFSESLAAVRTLEITGQSGSDTQEEALEQLSAAKAAVESLLSSGAVGRDSEVVVNLSGHANPGHHPRPGWAWDCITVSVSQKHPN